MYDTKSIEKTIKEKRLIMWSKAYNHPMGQDRLTFHGHQVNPHCCPPDLNQLGNPEIWRLNGSLKLKGLRERIQWLITVNCSWQLNFSSPEKVEAISTQHAYLWWGQIQEDWYRYNIWPAGTSLYIILHPWKPSLPRTEPLWNKQIQVPLDSITSRYKSLNI